jgi:hypothetical protein
MVSRKKGFQYAHTNHRCYHGLSARPFLSLSALAEYAAGWIPDQLRGPLNRRRQEDH